jgi:hypothetical protein
MILGQPRRSCPSVYHFRVNVCSQPTFRMSFGFSAGDILSAINLSCQLVKQCQELQQLERTLGSLVRECSYATDLE